MLIALALGLVIVVALCVWWFSSLTVKHRDRRLASLEDWDEWSVEERQAHVKQFLDEQIISDAMRWRIGASVGAAIVLGSMFMVSYLSADNEHLSNLAGEVCRSNRNDLVEREQALTADVRDLQHRRDDLIAEMESTAISIQGVPGYEDLDPATQRFLTSLLNEQIDASAVQVDEWGSELIAMRNRLDQLRAAIAASDCPS